MRFMRVTDKATGAWLDYDLDRYTLALFPVMGVPEKAAAFECPECPRCQVEHWPHCPEKTSGLTIKTPGVEKLLRGGEESEVVEGRYPTDVPPGRPITCTSCGQIKGYVEGPAFPREACPAGGDHSYKSRGEGKGSMCWRCRKVVDDDGNAVSEDDAHG